VLRPAIAEQMQQYRAQLGRSRLAPRGPAAAAPADTAVNKEEENAALVATGEQPPAPAAVAGLRPVAEIPTRFQSVFKEFSYFNKVRQ
jgi:hypothetical protein